MPKKVLPTERRLFSFIKRVLMPLEFVIISDELFKELLRDKKILKSKAKRGKELGLILKLNDR